MKKLKSILCLAFVLICGTLLFTACGPNKNNNDPPTTQPTYYVVSFDTNGGSNVDSIQVEQGKLISRPNNPTKNNYVFDGWYIDSNYNYEFRFAIDTINKDTTLYAKWIESLNQYTITFDTNGGNILSAIAQNEGTNLNLPTPTKSGYTFDYWYTDNLQPFTSTKMPSYNIKLYAKWKVAVDVYVDGILFNTVYANEETNYKLASLTKPEDITTNPMIEKYFYGYFLDPYFNVPLAETTTFTTNSRIYAKWINIDYSKYTYTVSNNKAIITGYTDNTATIVIIPKYINSYPVKILGNGRNTLFPATTKDIVLLCDELEEIAGGFRNCSNLTSLTIPNSVTTIGNSAFSGCSSLTSLTIPDSVNTIGEFAFSRCSSLTSLTIPYGVNTIVEYTFNDCSSLTSLTIPNSVTTIGKYAFSGCSSLTSLTIPDSVNTIGEFAFSGCSNLESIKLSESIKTISRDIFSNCSSLTSLTIPDSVTSLGEWQFSGCSSLTSIVLGSGISIITGYTLANCKNLTSLTIGENVTQIYSNAFEACTSLSQINFNAVNCEYFSYNNTIDYSGLSESSLSVTFGNKVEKIPDYLFYFCKALYSVTIPDNITSIGTYAFYGCSKLAVLKFSDNLTTIGNYAFSSCSSLTSLTIPDSVKTIDKHAFDYCSGLITLTINSVTSMGECAFSHCSNLTTVNLGENVETIGYEAFRECGNLTTVNFGENIKTIGGNAFYYCQSLTSIIIPDSVTIIGEQAFYNCRNINFVIIGKNVNDVGRFAFESCRNIYCKLTAKPDNWSSDWNRLGTVYWYSEKRPTGTGNYWHYVDNEIVIWS